MVGAANDICLGKLTGTETACTKVAEVTTTASTTQIVHYVEAATKPAAALVNTVYMLLQFPGLCTDKSVCSVFVDGQTGSSPAENEDITSTKFKTLEAACTAGKAGCGLTTLWVKLANGKAIKITPAG